MFAVASLVFSVLALAGAGWACSRSVPARVSSRAAEAREIAEHLEAEWRQTRAQLTAYLEDVQRVLDSVERKRKQVGAAAARLQPSNGEDADLSRMTPEQIRDHFTRVARARGLL